MEEKVASGRISFADAVLVLAGRLEVGISKLSVESEKHVPDPQPDFGLGRLQKISGCHSIMNSKHTAKPAQEVADRY